MCSEAFTLLKYFIFFNYLQHGIPLPFHSFQAAFGLQLKQWPFTPLFLSKHRPDHRAKECQDRYIFADTFNACANERMLRREHALWVTDKFIGTWEAWDCLCACHSCLRTVQGLWFHSQQWLLTDCSQPWALLHGLSPARTQPCPSEMPPFSHSYTVFTVCQLHAAGAQLKGVVKSHQWQLITCMETQPGDKTKGTEFSLQCETLWQS